MTLSDKLKQLMLYAEVSVAQLSADTNIERSTLARILNGSTTNPRLETMHSLAKYFKIGIDDFEINTKQEVDSNRAQPRIKDLRFVLRELMLKTGILSIVLLYKYTAIPQSVLSDILSGNTQKPNMATLTKLATFFKISVAQLVGAEPISNEELAEINPISNMLPILQIGNISSWVAGNKDLAESYTVSTFPANQGKVFAVPINDDKYKDDFSKNTTLIVNTEEVPHDGDMVVAKFNGKLSVFQFTDKNGKTTLREAGDTKAVALSKADKYQSYGVVVQQRIDRKKVKL